MCLSYNYVGTYCMPEEGVPLTPTQKLLSSAEVVRIAKMFVDQGVDKIRITGGEPLLRADLPSIISKRYYLYETLMLYT